MLDKSKNVFRLPSRRDLCTLAVISGVALFASSLPSVAGKVSEPTGDVILSIEGNVQNTNATGRADFDLAQIEAMPKVTFTTRTPWTKGETLFEGVLLRDLLKVTGAKGLKLKAIALNDYASELPTSDADNHNVIVAYKADGEYMSVRSKGPLWIIYPFDSDPDLRSEAVYARAVWQLRKIAVIN